jgi:hypothetical protein
MNESSGFVKALTPSAVPGLPFIVRQGSFAVAHFISMSLRLLPRYEACSTYPYRPATRLWVAIVVSRCGWWVNASRMNWINQHLGWSGGKPPSLSVGFGQAVQIQTLRPELGQRSCYRSQLAEILWRLLKASLFGTSRRFCMAS